MQYRYTVAKYLRLSLEDGDKLESDSIAHQRELLDYNIKRLFDDKKIDSVELIDDGYSGTNMDRPSLKKLLMLAKNKGIDGIMVKDFSRFARDYVEVGRYTEKLFPEWQIRFISVNDNYDSKDYIGITARADMALKNVIYTMYSRDLSEKIKSVRKAQHKRGDFVSPYAIFGYIKNPENKHQLIVDPEAANVVKRIFDMKYQGMSMGQIAVILNEEGILTPGRYKAEKGIVQRGWSNINAPACWSSSTVGNILHDERYTGKMICGKTMRTVVDSKKLHRFEKDEYIVTDNTHEAIVSQKLFKKVQSNKPKRCVTRKTYLFSGLIRCGACNRLMKFDTRSSIKKYYCDSLRWNGGVDCVRERISENELIEVVLEAINKELLKTVNIIEVQKNFEDIIKINQRTIKSLNDKIDKFKKKRVDDYVQFTKGEISAEEFQAKKNVLNNKIFEHEKELSEFRKSSLSADDLTVLNMFQKYVGYKELTHEMIVDLIKTIYVHNDKRIEVVWNFRERHEEINS